jgi:hypothetical protein
MSFHSLGVLYDAKGELVAARACHERALGIWERVLGLTIPAPP